MGNSECPGDADFESAGLYDPATEAGSGRLELLRWLFEQGFSLAEMKDGVEHDSIGSLAGDRRMLPGERMSTADAVALAGIPADEFDELAVALEFRPIQGAPEGDTGFTTEEVETIAHFRSLRELFSPEEAVSLVRTIGTSVARIAEASISLFLTDIESPHVLAGASELDLAHKIYDAVGIVDGFAAALDPILRRQMMQAIERTRRTTVGHTERFEFRYAIGFVDLVGFTELSAGMDAMELANFIRDFEARSHEMAARAGGRVIKLIGDEVMFVAEDAAAACRAGSALMEGFTAAGTTVVPRGGLAYGSVVPRGGDYYGMIVNLAARLVDQAVPGELLVTDALAEAAEGCEFAPAGRRMVKGFVDPIRVQSLVSVG
jgi:adenylate cyclase